MARTWLSVTVELLGGRGQELWPYPGRVFAIGPSHTFIDLAFSINTAFARWDLAHLSMFTLDDGRVVTDLETAAEMTGGSHGPLREVVDIDSAKVVRLVKPGSEFRYVFDLGDDWTHCCSVATQKVDPVEVFGFRPDSPLPNWGWGDIPDQYGRRWADEDGRNRAPRRPGSPHPMLAALWPEQRVIKEVDLAEVRAAIATSDATRFLDAVDGCEVDDVLQQIGAGIPAALESLRERVEPVALSIVNKLTRRGLPGDAELAADLLACLRREPLPGRVVPVDLEMLCGEMETDPNRSAGGYIDLQTGDVYNDELMDPDMVGEGNSVDVEDDPDRWLAFECIGSPDAWQDMADFTERQSDPQLRVQLERAIEGRGAFRRFRDLVHELDLHTQWYAFSTDRKFGRARKYLASKGVRVG